MTGGARLLRAEFQSREVGHRALHRERGRDEPRARPRHGRRARRSSVGAARVRWAPHPSVDPTSREQHPDVRSARARDPEVHVRHAERGQRRTHRRGSVGGGLQDLALAGRFVQLAATDLHGGVRGRRLERVALERGHRGSDVGRRSPSPLARRSRRRRRRAWWSPRPAGPSLRRSSGARRGTAAAASPGRRPGRAARSPWGRASRRGRPCACRAPVGRRRRRRGTSSRRACRRAAALPGPVTATRAGARSAATSRAIVPAGPCSEV